MSPLEGAHFGLAAVLTGLATCIGGVQRSRTPYIYAIRQPGSLRQACAACRQPRRRRFCLIDVCLNFLRVLHLCLSTHGVRRPPGGPALRAGVGGARRLVRAYTNTTSKQPYRQGRTGPLSFKVARAGRRRFPHDVEFPTVSCRRAAVSQVTTGVAAAGPPRSVPGQVCQRRRLGCPYFPSGRLSVHHRAHVRAVPLVKVFNHEPHACE